MILVQVVVVGVVASRSSSQVAQLNDAVVPPSVQGLEMHFAGGAHHASPHRAGEVQNKLPSLPRQIFARFVQLQDELVVGT